MLSAGRSFSREHILSDNEALQLPALSKKCLGFHEMQRGTLPTSLFPISLSPGISYVTAFLPSNFGDTKSPCCESALIVSRPSGPEIILLENVFMGAGEL